MSRHLVIPLAILASIMPLQLGCGSDPTPTSEKPATPTSSVSEKKAAPSVGDSSNLPAVQPMPQALDKGRVEISYPSDWDFLGRDSKYLVRFFSAGRNDPPRILVTVAESSDENFTTIDADNAAAFRAQVKQQVDSNLLEKEELVRPVSMVTLGGRPWIEHCRYGRIPNKKAMIQRLILQTLVNDRLYQVELWVYRGELKQSEKAAYAIAGGMKFIDSVTE
jgi:hypothetical protein